MKEYLDELPKGFQKDHEKDHNDDHENKPNAGTSQTLNLEHLEEVVQPGDARVGSAG